MNIEKHISLLKKKYQKEDPQFTSLNKIFSKHVNNFSKSMYSVSGTTLFLKNMRPLLKTKILLNKESLLKEMQSLGLNQIR